MFPGIINFDGVRRAKFRDIPASSLLATCPAQSQDFDTESWEAHRGEAFLVGDVNWLAPCGERLWPMRASSVKVLFPNLNPDKPLCLCGHMVEVEELFQ